MTLTLASPIPPLPTELCLGLPSVGAVRPQVRLPDAAAGRGGAHQQVGTGHEGAPRRHESGQATRQPGSRPRTLRRHFSVPSSGSLHPAERRACGWARRPDSGDTHTARSQEGRNMALAEISEATPGGDQMGWHATFFTDA